MSNESPEWSAPADGTDAAGRSWFDVCLVAAPQPTEAERPAAPAGPDPPTPYQLRCQLHVVHLDAHVSPALPAPAGAMARWLTWRGAYQEFFDAEGCPAAPPPDLSALEDPERCRLPSGHCGPHSFLYLPTGTPAATVVLDHELRTEAPESSPPADGHTGRGRPGPQRATG